MKKRSIREVITPKPQQGFLGKGHTAKAVIDGQHFEETDPFIILMDDRLDLPGGEPVGGPHPHAGFETVTLVLKGDGKEWHTGSMELMTAGSGIIHTEEIAGRADLHILQLWLALPPSQRWAAPAWQKIMPEAVPVLTTGKTEIRVYSGNSNGLVSPMINHTPFTLAEFNMKPGAKAQQELPSAYNGMIYVLQGTVWINETQLKSGQMAWLDKPEADDDTQVVFETKEEAAHFVLYAGQPHGAAIVSHGPFIGDTRDDIIRLYKEYSSGKMGHLNDLAESEKTTYSQAI